MNPFIDGYYLAFYFILSTRRINCYEIFNNSKIPKTTIIAKNIPPELRKKLLSYEYE